MQLNKIKKIASLIFASLLTGLVFAAKPVSSKDFRKAIDVTENYTAATFRVRYFLPNEIKKILEYANTIGYSISKDEISSWSSYGIKDDFKLLVLANIFSSMDGLTPVYEKSDGSFIKTISESLNADDIIVNRDANGWQFPGVLNHSNGYQYSFVGGEPDRYISQGYYFVEGYNSDYNDLKMESFFVLARNHNAEISTDKQNKVDRLTAMKNSLAQQFAAKSLHYDALFDYDGYYNTYTPPRIETKLDSSDMNALVAFGELLGYQFYNTESNITNLDSYGRKRSNSKGPRSFTTIKLENNRNSSSGSSFRLSSTDENTLCNLLSTIMDREVSFKNARGENITSPSGNNSKNKSYRYYNNGYIKISSKDNYFIFTSNEY